MRTGEARRSSRTRSALETLRTNRTFRTDLASRTALALRSNGARRTGITALALRTGRSGNTFWTVGPLEPLRTALTRRSDGPHLTLGAGEPGLTFGAAFANRAAFALRSDFTLRTGRTHGALRSRGADGSFRTSVPLRTWLTALTLRTGRTGGARVTITTRRAAHAFGASLPGRAALARRAAFTLRADRAVAAVTPRDRLSLLERDDALRDPVHLVGDRQRDGGNLVQRVGEARLPAKPF